MNPQRPEVKDRFALGAIALLGAVLIAGCTSIGAESQAQGRNGVSGG